VVQDLVLEGLGAGRDHHLFAAQDGRNEIGPGLTGAGPGFHQQRLLTGQGGEDGLSHLLLLGTVFKGSDFLGQEPFRSEVALHRAAFGGWGKA